MADPLFPGDQPLLDALALMDEHNRLRAKAAAAERLAGSLMEIEWEAGEKWIRDSARAALAQWRSLSSPADSQEPDGG